VAIDEFEWYAAKAVSNLRKHGIAFNDALLVFDDLFAIHDFDVDAGYGEQRIIVTGLVNGTLLTVVYTERGERTRLISARKATRNEQLRYYRRQTQE
jgi:uncharacterized DUF497 family protein